MFEFAAKNNFIHKHIPFGHLFMAKSQKVEATFLGNHYFYSKKPFSTDQHVMFVNAVEHYGLQDHERYNQEYNNSRSSSYMETSVPVFFCRF